jgi:hypothetical protein
MTDWVKLADDYLAANAAESGADELIRGMAEVLRTFAPAQPQPVPIKENDLARFFLGIVVSERKGIGDVFDSAKDFLAKYNVTVRGSEITSTQRGPAEPLQCLRCGTVDAFGPVSAEKK